MIGGQHDLLRLYACLACYLLKGINGGSINIGLARFAKSSIAYGYAESLQQRLERRGSAIHAGRLNNFGREKPTSTLGGAH